MMTGFGVTLMLRAFVAEPVVSAAFTVKFAVPEAVAVPLIRPELFIVKPEGSAPVVIDHVYVPVPPLP